MKNVEKYTKRDKFVDIKTILGNVDAGDYDIAALVEFVDAEIGALDRKAAKAKEAAAAKKTERDELCEAVAAVLTAEPKTRDEITALIEGDEITVAKVGARLNKLVAAGDAVKTEIASVSASGKKSTKMAYSLPAAE